MRIIATTTTSHHTKSSISCRFVNQSSVRPLGRTIRPRAEFASAVDSVQDGDDLPTCGLAGPLILLVGARAHTWPCHFGERRTPPGDGRRGAVSPLLRQTPAGGDIRPAFGFVAVDDRDAVSVWCRFDRLELAASHPCKIAKEFLEAPPGFEPGMEVLQTSALPHWPMAPFERSRSRRSVEHYIFTGEVRSSPDRF